MYDIASPAVPPQPVRALQLANRVRCARADLKHRIAEGTLAAADVILACPVEANRMPIQELLASQRGWGRYRSRAFLVQVALREDKPLGTLTERQRGAVAALLDTRSPTRG